MGTLKPLLDWFGAPLVQRQIESLKAGGVDEVYVVIGNRAYEVQEAIRGEGVQSVINPHYREGKSTSIKAGGVGMSAMSPRGAPLSTQAAIVAISSSLSDQSSLKS